MCPTYWSWFQLMKGMNWVSSTMGPSRVVIYKVMNWVSSIKGPSRVVIYMVMYWVSSIMGPSLVRDFNFKKGLINMMQKIQVKVEM
jgi:hypothetical protein